MSETADPLVLDFVEWIAREPRAYAEVISTWKTSCPRLTIWPCKSDQQCRKGTNCAENHRLPPITPKAHSRPHWANRT